VAELATAWLPAPLTTSAALRLWQETGGLPLFVTEYLAAFSRDGQVPDGGQWQLPGGMRDLLQSRLDGLGETTRQVLAAGAVLGRDLSPDLLRATSGRGEAEVVDALDEAVDRAVVVQTERGTHEFGHESMRQLIYDTSSLARKRLLHSRAADALAGRRVPPAAPDVVAAHLRLAGRADESAVWSWQAAERARGLYAHGEALEHLAAAAAHGHPGQEVHQATGDVLTALGRYREAIDAYERAAATTPADDALALATLEHRLAEVHHRLGAWDVAASHLAAALGQLSGEGGEALRARVLADTALVAHRRGHAGEAAAAAESSLVIAAEAGDHAALAQAHDVLGVLAAESHDVALAERHLQVSLEHASVLADPGYRVAALNNLALVRADNGEADAAVAVAREALQLGLEHGDRHRAAALHANLADLLHASGHQQEAREHLTSAARLYATLDDDDLRRPEIWKLARW
jgi:tetratricopeptide (TPR) repeat protein